MLNRRIQHPVFEICGEWACQDCNEFAFGEVLTSPSGHFGQLKELAGRSSHIAFALVSSPGVVKGQESLQVLIQFLHGGIDFRAERHLVELFEDGTVEPLAGPVGPGMADLGQPVLDFEFF